MEFTVAEWTWLKNKRATSARLDQMMTAIPASGAVDVAPNGPLDEFYAWLLSNGIPGGQARVRQLRRGLVVS